MPLSFAQLITKEIEQEAVSTARMLERVPPERLDWRPHPKSTTLGDLAWHVASIPRRIVEILEAGRMQTSGAKPSVRGGNDFTGELQANIATAVAWVEAHEETLFDPFFIVRGDEVLRQLPKAAALRTILMNHSIHHRGQLSVYLRLLDVPVPAMYGTSADESAF